MSAYRGIRIVYEMKRDAMASVVLNQLYKFTELQTSFSVNNIALVKGRPVLLDLKNMIRQFRGPPHGRGDAARSSTSAKRRRAHILEGLLIASILDEGDQADPRQPNAGYRPRRPDDAIRAQRHPGAAPSLDMRLQRLTGLERDKIEAGTRRADEADRPPAALLADEGHALRGHQRPRRSDRGEVRRQAPHEHREQRRG